jgi:hypothetical protein
MACELPVDSGVPLSLIALASSPARFAVAPRVEDRDALAARSNR